MKRNNFVFVSSILMIIGGAISLIVGLIALFGAAVLIAAGLAGSIYTFACILIFLSAVVELIAGIVGCVNAAKPNKWKALLIWGIIVIAIYVVGEIISLVSGGSFNVLSLILSLVLPVLYIIGALQLKKAAEAPVAEVE